MNDLTLPMHPTQAKELAVLLLGSYPKSDAALPEVYLRQMQKLLQRHQHDLANKILDEVIHEYRTLPSIAAVSSSLNKAVNEIRNPPPQAEPMPQEAYTPRGWDGPGVRDKLALAAMMRILNSSLVLHDVEAHNRIVTVAGDPPSWPAFLDEHGDDEWKKRNDQVAK